MLMLVQVETRERQLLRVLADRFNTLQRAKGWRRVVWRVRLDQ